jgi:hypothetical protein
MLMIFTKQFFGCGDDIITSFKGERIFYVGCVKRQKNHLNSHIGTPKFIFLTSKYFFLIFLT